MTGAPVPWVPGSGVGRRPHRGRGPDALPANYLLLCVCITSSALVVRTLGLVHLRTGSSDRGYLSRGSLAVSQPRPNLFYSTPGPAKQAVPGLLSYLQPTLARHPHPR